MLTYIRHSPTRERSCFDLMRLTDVKRVMPRIYLDTVIQPLNSLLRTFKNLGEPVVVHQQGPSHTSFSIVGARCAQDLA